MGKYQAYYVGGPAHEKQEDIPTPSHVRIIVEPFRRPYLSIFQTPVSKVADIIVGDIEKEDHEYLLVFQMTNEFLNLTTCVYVWVNPQHGHLDISPKRSKFCKEVTGR